MKYIKPALILLFVCFPYPLRADENLQKADSLYDLGGVNNFKHSIEFYKKAWEQLPDDYQANWKYARACRDYADQAKQKQLKNWKAICTKFGKKGMQYAEKAMALQPDKPEGFYYYALSVGTYSDGVSILTALKEGLKNKTQKSLEKAFALDKTYSDGGPPLALGRFWAVVPWPFKNKEKALHYYREYQKVTKYALHKAERLVYIAELLIDIGKQHYPEAKRLLEQALKTQNRYIKNWAQELLDDIN